MKTKINAIFLIILAFIVFVPAASADYPATATPSGTGVDGCDFPVYQISPAKWNGPWTYGLTYNKNYSDGKVYGYACPGASLNVSGDDIHVSINSVNDYGYAYWFWDLKSKGSFYFGSNGIPVWGYLAYGSCGGYECEGTLLYARDRGESIMPIGLGRVGISGYLAPERIDYSCSPGDTLVGNVCITPKVDGICGPSNGQNLSTAPASGYCNAGIFSGLSGSGPWSWSCFGNNGTTATCQTAAPTVSCNKCSLAEHYTRESFKSFNADCSTVDSNVTKTEDCVCGPKIATLGSNGANCGVDLTFSATSPIQKGQSTTLTWKPSPNVTSCIASSDANGEDGGWNGTNPQTTYQENTLSLTPTSLIFPRTMNYSLTCSNAISSITKTAPVNLSCTPKLTNYRCQLENQGACTPEQCGTSKISQKATCWQKDENSCSGFPEVQKPLQECIDAGETCADVQIQCQACVKSGNWTEVNL